MVGGRIWFCIMAFYVVVESLNHKLFSNEISMSLKITPTAMNMPQHYPQREKSVRTLTRDHFEQACVVWGEKVRCRSLSPVGEKQVITPCKAIAAARGRKNHHHLQNSVGVQQMSYMLRLPQKKKNLTARGAKGLRKEHNTFILRPLFFVSFAKNLCAFALKNQKTLKSNNL